jgi:hypothetical protein
MDEIVGALGGPAGVTSAEGVEYEPDPVAFIANTLNL